LTNLSFEICKRVRKCELYSVTAKEFFIFTLNKLVFQHPEALT